MQKNEIQNVISKVEKIVEPVLEKLLIGLVDIEYLQDGAYWFLRVYIEKENEEISLENCAQVSLAIEGDIDSLLKEKYFLEVSSPGLERPLKKAKDYTRFTGKKARLILKHKIDDKRNYTGRIKEYKDGIVTLELEDRELKIEYNEIKKSNLVFEFEDLK